MADAKMFWIPPFGLFLTFCGGIKVKSTFRGFGLALGESIEVSKKGIIVFMFPQGERQKGHWSRLNNFKDGVSSISEKADVPILPIFLSLPGLFARVTWKRLYLCPQPVTIVYGALIHREGKEGKQLTKHVENIMKVMLAENLPNWYVHKNILKHKKPQHV